MDTNYKLSTLASQLQSDQDRKKYIKVIEMSKVIQSKLDSIHQGNDIVRSTRSTLDRKSSVWTLSQDIPSHRSSAISDNTTIVAGSSCGDHKSSFDSMNTGTFIKDSHM